MEGEGYRFQTQTPPNCINTHRQVLDSWFFGADLLVRMVFKSWALNPAEGSKVTVSRNM